MPCLHPALPHCNVGLAACQQHWLHPCCSCCHVHPGTSKAPPCCTPSGPCHRLTTAQVATRLDLDEDYAAALRQAAGPNASWVATNAYTTWLTRLPATKPVGKLLLWWTVNNSLRMTASLLRMPLTTEEQRHLQTRTNITAYNIVAKEVLPGTHMKVLQEIHKILFGFDTAKEFKQAFGVQAAHELNRLLRVSSQHQCMLPGVCMHSSNILPSCVCSRSRRP